jgi:hypothetical protein
MSNSERNGADFYSLARRKRKHLRNRRRNKTFTISDAREATQELDDRTYAVLTRRQMTN